MEPRQSTNVVEHPSPLGFGPTLECLSTAIRAAGLSIFAQIDHAAGARGAGLVMPPATVLIYGHPSGGTPVMLAAPHAALDLPLRVLVLEREDGQTLIAFHPAAAMLRAAGVPESLAARLDPAQDLLLKSLTL